MNKKVSLLLFGLMFTGSMLLGQQAAEVSYSFTRQTGPGSNQYAIWIENARGEFVKTIHATRWTANGGWRTRPTSIPFWVRQSGLSTSPREQVDVISGATPATGTVAFTHTWDGTDYRGQAVPSGNYVLIFEATIRGANQVYYRVPIQLGHGTSVPQVTVGYYIEGDTDTTIEREMISNLTVRVLR